MVTHTKWLWLDFVKQLLLLLLMDSRAASPIMQRRTESLSHKYNSLVWKWLRNADLFGRKVVFYWNKANSSDAVWKYERLCCVYLFCESADDFPTSGMLRQSNWEVLTKFKGGFNKDGETGNSSDSHHYRSFWVLYWFVSLWNDKQFKKNL